MECSICKKESKFVFIDDGVCHHWERELKGQEIEQLIKSLKYKFEKGEKE